MSMQEAIIQTPPPQNSVEVSTDAKGNYKVTVKTYAGDIDKAVESAVAAYKNTLYLLQTESSVYDDDPEF